MTILEAENMVKKRGGKAILNGFSMRLDEGKVYGLIGKHKSGKSSVLRAIMGLTHLKSGSAIWHIDRRNIGAYVAEPAYHRELSIKENLAAQTMVLYGKADYERVKYLMETLKITEHHVGNRSMRNMLIDQRVCAGVAMAFLGKPDVLILDEPFLGLDQEWWNSFCEVFSKEIVAEKKTALITAKSEKELDGIATDFIYIEDGKNA